MKRGHRFQVTIIGQGAPVVCVRAANGDEAERVAAECLGFRGTKKGARKPFALAMGSMPTLIVVEGWVDVKIPDAYHPAVTSADTGVTTQRGRARSCDPIWGHEARAAAHASGKVLFDAHEMGENRAAA